MVVGHYGCSGCRLHSKARASVGRQLVRHIQDVRDRHRGLLDAMPERHRHDALVELNVIEQVVMSASAPSCSTPGQRSERQHSRLVLRGERMACCTISR